MPKFSGWLTAVLLAGALAIPASALAQVKFGSGKGTPAAQHNSGGGGHTFTPHAGGGGFTPHVSGRSFAPHFSGRSFAPHVGTRTVTPRFSGRSRQFGTVHRGTTFNRSVQRTQRLHNFTQSNSNTHARRLHSLTQSNSNNRTLRNTTAVQTNTQRALRRNGAAAITPLAARQGRFGSRFAARTGAGRFANVAAHRA